MQLAGLNIGIVADDMTGANDTALQFLNSGITTHVLVDLQNAPPPPQDTNQVWAVNTDTRHVDPNIAEATVRAAVALLKDKYSVEHFYKKMDSTLRGHIAHECLGFLDALGGDCVLVVPGYPAEERSTVGGYQLMSGIPVEKTSVARDPLFPIRQSHLPTLLEQNSSPTIVGHISLSYVLKGAVAILGRLNELIQAGKKLVVVDSTSNEDLEQIALAFERAQKMHNVLPCGTAGFAQVLTRLWCMACDTERAEILAPESPILIVSGSVSTKTRLQLKNLIQHYSLYGRQSQLHVFELPPEKILGLQPVDTEIADIIHAMDDRNTVILTTALSDDNYTKTIALAAEQDISEKQASRMTQEVLARMTHTLVKQKPCKLVITGGEVASSVCKVLDIRALQVLAEVERSIPLCADAKGRWMITKSGNFGSDMAMANIVQYLKDHETEVAHA